MVLAWSAGEWTQILEAVASLAWPLMIAAALFAFRKPIRALIARGREIEVPGLKATFDPPDPGPIEQVKRQLPRASELVLDEADATEEGEAASTTRRTVVAPYDEVADDILRLATQDVRVAFIKLADALEARVRDLASAWGGLDPHKPRWQDLLDGLVKNGVIPAGVASNVTLLDRMSSAVIRGEARYREGDALTALDGGLDLLVALDGIPVQGYEVVEAGVELYQDQNCAVAWEDATGVILRQRKPKGRTSKPTHPYPTRKTYESGDLVGWQWSFDEAPREFYWRAPDGPEGPIESAWFVGEHLRRPAK